MGLTFGKMANLPIAELREEERVAKMLYGWTPWLKSDPNDDSRGLVVQWDDGEEMMREGFRKRATELLASLSGSTPIGKREVQYEVWQASGHNDEMPVAGSTSLDDALHYLAVYGQDGPVRLVEVVRTELASLTPKASDGESDRG